MEFESREEEAQEAETVVDEFEAGFNGAVQGQDDIPVVAEEASPTLIAGVAEDEVAVLFDKARQFDSLSEKLASTHEWANGRIGDLERQLNELSQQRQHAAVTKDNLQAVRAYFDDDDLVEALAKDLSALNMGAIIPDAVDYGAISEVVNARIDEISKDFEVKLLAVQHPDWQEVSQSEGWAKWRTTLPEAQLEALETSWDGALIGKAMTAYKKWSAAKVDAEEKKVKRLEDAVQLKAHPGGNRQFSDDAFEAGMKKVLG